MVSSEVERDEEILSDASHVVIDHESSKREMIESKMSEFHQKCRLIELRRAKKMVQRSNILPPAFVRSWWKHLQCKDLYPELFDIQKSERNVRSETYVMENTKRPVPTLTPSSDVDSKTFSDYLPSPAKRLNKAVGNIFQRTPTKTKSLIFVETDLLDEFAGIGDLDDDRDLISSILSDEKFVESELNLKEVDEKDLDFDVVKTWFNQVI